MGSKTSSRRRRVITAIGGFITALIFGSVGAAQAQAVTLIDSDLEFMLKQIKISEAHAQGGSLTGPGEFQISNPLFPYGVRTVDGRLNNLQPGQANYGAADTVFPRLVSPLFRDAENLTFDPDGPGPRQVGDSTSYAQKTGIVSDSAPRTISNLIADQTANNPAAVQAAADNPNAVATDHDGNPDTPDQLYIPNRAPDEGLSAPYNSWFTLFGQFFDHGLDLVTKGNSGTVFVPLKADDPLIVGADGRAGTADDPANPPPPSQRFMVLTRTTNQPGPDGVVGTADDIKEATNTTTSFVDQNQTYTSHPSHQVFLREYELNEDDETVATGRMIDGAAAGGGIANWGEIKAQARDLLGIELRDVDVLNVPLLATDQYGHYLRGPNGYAQLVTAGNVLVEGDPTANDGRGVSTASAVRTGHAFLDDIAHLAVPRGDHDGNPATPADALAPDEDTDTGNDDNLPATYDDELLAAHYATGDGRGNENIGLTAVHHVFHSEHNRLVDHIQDVVLETADGEDVAFLNEWLLDPVTEVPADPSTLVWNGERIFQAAKFGTEMQYQHLVFEEFARKVQPQVNIFSGYETDVDPAIVAEFAHTVYRFGHSMLNEDVARTNNDNSKNDIGLIEAFLNPEEFKNSGATADEAAGAIARGMTSQVGNELDEFVTDALRNNLLGLPLDLPTINLARGRDTGVPSLNAARRKFYAGTSDSALQPYENWIDFKLGIRHPKSLINFIAAYGRHPTIMGLERLDERRAQATAIVDDVSVTLPGLNPGDPDRVFDPPADRVGFLNSTGTWASGANGVTTTGLDDVDFWIGGLAEKQMPFGGMLGSTFNFVFEVQMEKLQNGDRFYYLSRLAGLNFLTELEQNSFAGLVMRNTDTKHLPGDVFSRPDFVIERGDPSTWVLPDDPATPEDEFRQLADLQGDTLRFEGGEHIVMGGTDSGDKMRADIGDDTLWGDDGPDRLEGGAGNDINNGGAGDDILSDLFGDDNLKGGPGNDAMNAGPGFDLLLPGTGKDFVVAGSDPSETFGGPGDDFMIMGDDADTGFADEGDDWLEGGAQADLMQGGNGAPFQDDTITGNDVLIGDGGNDDYDSEGGHDIMVTGPGIERNEGMLGFDWVTHRGDPQPSRADMDFTGLQPPDEDNVRDRFDDVEGLSGWKFDDTLRGDSGDAATMEGHELNNATQISLIDGLSGVLGGATSFTGGNVILGGEGSDLIEGRGGNDIIDGDRWLDVQLQAPDVVNGGTKKVDSMTALQADVFRGDINPGDIEVVREIETPAADPEKIDTAEFSEPRANYDVIVDQDDPTLATVVHARGSQIDGTDTLRNIERVAFSDETVDIVTITTNTAATGTVNISDNTPAENQVLTATQAIEDDDGVNLSTLVLTWQGETDPNVWTTISSGPNFTPTEEEIGLRLRVVATFRDGDGVLERVLSDPTAAVANVNESPTGAPVLDDATPTEEVPVTVTTGNIADGDGLTGAVFTRQWQRGDGTTWTNIAGATNPTFTPLAAHVGQRLRVLVSYTDDQGTNEQVASAATAPVAAAPVAPIAPLTGGGAAGGDAGDGDGGPALLSLRGALIPRSLDADTVASDGLLVSFTAPEGASIVRVRVLRPKSTRSLAKVFIKVKSGKVKKRLRHKALKRALKRGGRFKIEMTPGTSRKKLGVPTVRKITVRR